MCAQFTIKFLPHDLARFFEIELPHEKPEREPGKVLPFTRSWVLTAPNDERTLSLMQFSLLPSWSDTRRPKFATHNARIETLTQKPTWREPLRSRRALVPLDGFIEPIYHGELRGNMVRFFEENSRILAACALYDEWRDRETGEVIHSFAIITGEPDEFVRTTGHDRQPVFLERSNWAQWLASAESDSKRLCELMRDGREHPEFKCEIDRALKPGWEKRAGA